MSSTFDVLAARAHFPALASGYLYADNAGGSQCAADVTARISDYLLNSNVQLGADYSVSVTSTDRVKQGGEAARELFNAESADEIVFGSSSTMLVENLSRAMESDVRSDEEVIVTGEHECECPPLLFSHPPPTPAAANAGPWKRLAARTGATLKMWAHTPIAAYPNNPYAVALQLDALLPLITPKTRLIAFTACSNILGSIVPVKEIVAAVRARAAELGARKIEFCVDCVAYAPHRGIDVRAWDVDYCYFSFYKVSPFDLYVLSSLTSKQVYGAHTSALYARASALAGLSSLGHHFLSTSGASPAKLQPGGPGYELTYSCTGVPAYLRALTPSGTLVDAWTAVAAHEQALLTILLGYLRGKEGRGVRIVGDEMEGGTRVPTVSFVVAGERAMSSKAVVRAFDAKGDVSTFFPCSPRAAPLIQAEQVGIRYGHFYAYSLVDGLSPKVNIDEGVVRISLVHYNTADEVLRIVEILEEVLA